MFYSAIVLSSLGLVLASGADNSTFAHSLNDPSNEQRFVVKSLYNPTSGPTSVTLPINRDLDYIVRNWKKPHCDGWSQSRGQHLYGLLMARQALLRGAELVNALADGKPETVRIYRDAATEIQVAIRAFWRYVQSFCVCLFGLYNLS
jgi:hypothetical protein